MLNLVTTKQNLDQHIEIIFVITLKSFADFTKQIFMGVYRAFVFPQDAFTFDCMFRVA